MTAYLIMFLVALTFGIVVGFKARKVAHSPRDVRAPHPDGLGWKRTALYRYFDRGGNLLYVGIAYDPQGRAKQHAAAPDEHELSRRVHSVEAHWLPDRYSALCAEWALIQQCHPPFNRMPSGPCDAHTQKRPPIVPVAVRYPKLLHR